MGLRLAFVYKVVWLEQNSKLKRIPDMGPGALDAINFAI